MGCLLLFVLKNANVSRFLMADYDAFGRIKYYCNIINRFGTVCCIINITMIIFILIDSFVYVMILLK